jgi:succinoglycan biosynthesis transport protein ExoP
VLGTSLLARLATPPRKVVRRGGLVMYSRPQSEHGDAYRVLVANFDLANASSQSKVIMLTSAAAREGKTTATANLGIALARAGRRVAILDFDFHRPTLGGYFGLENASGLSDVLTGAAALSEALNRVPIRDSVDGIPRERSGDGELTVVPAGRAPARALDRVSTPHVGDLLEVTKHEFDVVLVDTPPLMAASEGLALAKEVDAVIMLVRADRAAAEQLEELRRRLQLSGRLVLGFIVTGGAPQGGYGFSPSAHYNKAAVDHDPWSVSGNGHRAEVRLGGTRVET